jgi:phosphoribosylanthranilate isomerase
MWIKICGLNNLAIAREIAGLHPDAVGLNFFEQSIRSVAPATARQIAEMLPAEIEAIGVFVEASTKILRETTANCRLSGVQFHAAGLDDPLKGWADSAEVLKTEEPTARPRRIRAFQIGPNGLAPLAEYFERNRHRPNAVDAYLVDAQVDGMYGGTGKRVSWDLLRNEYQTQEWPPLILAGGLRPENVAEAIAAVRPWGVDVASGVESSPGVKDADLVARFIEEARRAFALLQPE